MTLLENKVLLVAAHRARDWGAAARLSQERETIKRTQPRRCLDCGCRIHRHANRCFICFTVRKHYRRSIPQPSTP